MHVKDKILKQNPIINRDFRKDISCVNIDFKKMIPYQEIVGTLSTIKKLLNAFNCYTYMTVYIFHCFIKISKV